MSLSSAIYNPVPALPAPFNGSNPSQQVTPEVCAHRFGFDSSAIVSTDLLYPDTYQSFEAALFKNNIGFTAFVPKTNLIGGVSNTSMQELHQAGRGNIELHFRTDNWFDPISQDVQPIPDYYATVWTVLGETYFPVTAGIPKPAHYPNHGQELFDLSIGTYGYDTLTQSPGTNNLDEFLPYLSYEQSIMITLRGSQAKTFSYGNGETGCAPIMAYERLMIGGRNSVHESIDLNQVDTYAGEIDTIEYGQNPDTLPDELITFVNKNVSTRHLEPTIIGNSIDPSLFAPSLTFCNTALQESQTDKGIYHNYSHWEYYFGPTSPYTNSDYRLKFWDLVNVFGTSITTSGKKIYSESFERIMEYVSVRELVSSTNAFFSGSILNVQVDLANPNSIDLAKVSIPLSIRLDLTDTIFEGKKIRSSSSRVVSITSEGTDKYIVEVSLQNSISGFVFTIEETVTPSYLNFNIPKVTAFSFTATGVQITTDLPTKVTLFHKTSAASPTRYRILKRDNTVSITHNINLTVNNLNISLAAIQAGDLGIGAITPYTKQSTLIEI